MKQRTFARRTSLLSAAFAALAILVTFVGCITIPLGDPEQSKADAKLTGVWFAAPEANGKQSLFACQPYDARTSLVCQMDFTKAPDGSIKIETRMDWKLWLTEVNGQTFATLQIVDPRLLVDPTDEKYFICRLTRGGDNGMTLESVKDEFVKAHPEVKTAADLRDLVTKNLGNVEMFGGKLELTRMTDVERDLAGRVMKAFTTGG